VVPIEALAPPMAKEAAPVLAAWRALAQVPAVGAESMTDVPTILLETVPDLRSGASHAACYRRARNHGL
jgi:hypothetical protein